jgi:excinuclease UvrABC ATPase subunit
VDRIEHLNAPIIIDQKRVGGGSRSTVGTYTDIAALLRLLFSGVGQPYAGPAYAFSFNTPQGMCPECEGIGKTVQLDLDKFLDRSKVAERRGDPAPGVQGRQVDVEDVPALGLFDNDKPIKDYTDEELHALLYGADVKVSWGEFGSKYEGLVERFTRMYIKKGRGGHVRAQPGSLRAVHHLADVPVCAGARLNQAPSTAGSGAEISPSLPTWRRRS